MNNHINKKILEEETCEGDETETGWGFRNIYQMFMGICSHSSWDYWSRDVIIKNNNNKLIKMVRPEETDDFIEGAFNDSDMEYLMDAFVRANKLNMLFEEIVLECECCSVEIERNSREHDNCKTENGEDWYCEDCDIPEEIIEGEIIMI